MGDIVSRSETLYMLHELVSRIEKGPSVQGLSATRGADELLLKRAKRFIERFNATVDAVVLPGWVETHVCEDCGGDYFNARLNAKSNVRLCPKPICLSDSQNVLYLNTVYVEFDSLVVRVLKGATGTRWLLHEQICGRNRPEEGDWTFGAWLSTYPDIDSSGSVQELMKAANG